MDCATVAGVAARSDASLKQDKEVVTVVGKFESRVYGSTEMNV